MPRCCAVLLMLSLASTGCLASEREDQANAFTRIYASLCLKNLHSLEALREQLKRIPALPPDMAAPFLTGKPGEAWHVPDKHGTFVLALLSGKNFCAVFARRADTETVIKAFTAWVTHPPAPLTAKQVRNEQAHTRKNGTNHTVAYEWSVPDATKKMLFTLTTAASETAELQVLGSAAVIGQ